METQNIYIAQYYPGGWFHCYEIPEKECIDAYLKSVSRYQLFGNIYHYDIFNMYMGILHNPLTLIAKTENGHIIRYWNNQAWIVIEASNTLQAVHKALDIFTEKVK